MRYGSVCSGVEAATAAWHPLGWEPQWFSEIEKFPSAVLEHHYPDVPNLGDMTQFKEWKDDPIDLLVGGTPCQSFSIAGLRKGLDDPRGNLMLTYIAIAERYKPKWIVWENVPGVLSSNRGRDFGTFLTALGEIGYGFAYRVLDAQYFGVAQRRRRVFVVGYLGDWRRAAAVLFERESMSGHPAPSRETGQEAAQCLTTRTGSAYDPTTETLPVAPAVAWSIMPMNSGKDYKARITDVAQPIMAGGPVGGNQGGDFIQQSAVRRLTPTLDKSKTPAVFYEPVRYGAHQQDTLHHESGILSCLPAGTNNNAGYYTKTVTDKQVRRLTPTECERLQGFPDGYTQIAWRNKEPENCPDGPRYKAMGNSMAVPVMRWIGERIKKVEEITQ